MTDVFHHPKTGETFEADPDRPRTPVGSCTEALDAHLRFNGWLRGSASVGVFDALARTLGDQASGGPSQRRMMGAFVEVADTVFVSAEMSNLAAQVAEANGEHVPVLHRTDMPAPIGLLIFGEPAALVESDDEWASQALTRAILWAVVEPGGLVQPEGAPTFELTAGDPGPVADSLQAGGVVLFELYDAGEYLVAKGAFDANGRPPFVPVGSSAIPFGVAAEWDLHTEGRRNGEWALARLFATTLRLMWQRVAPAEEWTPPRSQGRRWQRSHPSGRPARVVHLRRYEAVEPGERPEPGSGRSLDHMVTVRGHWRDQWYRSLGLAYIDGVRNEGSHRRIWIDSHTRGEGDHVDKPAVTVVTR